MAYFRSVAVSMRSVPPAYLGGPSAPATFRVALEDGRATTVHLAAYDLAEMELEVVALPNTQPLIDWCRSSGVEEALVGGFFVRTPDMHLGELRLGGEVRDSVPFMRPWDSVRACVHVEHGTARIARRPDLPERPGGDLLQAGPLLVEGGRAVFVDGVDSEGFSIGQAQFDSDITDGRYPRAALGIADGIAFALACDGRSPEDAGLTLGELAELLAALGAREALNLDGGGSATLVSAGRIVNAPREHDGTPIPGGRPVITAVVFSHRAP
jgi:hypothetical protein